MNSFACHKVTIAIHQFFLVAEKEKFYFTLIHFSPQLLTV